MDKYIRVTGKGQIGVKPDLIRLTLTLEDTREKYEDTLEQSAKQVELLKDCFEKLGFARTDLKTQHFNIDTVYEGYQDENRVWKNRFTGYKFNHSMKIEFDADNKRLGQVLYGLAQADVSPEFHINYTIKNTEAVKNKLLGKAVEDSKAKALVLAEAAGVKLGELVSVDYSWGEKSFVSEPMSRNMPLLKDCRVASTGYNINIEPDDINVSDTVTVVWQIGGQREAQ